MKKRAEGARSGKEASRPVVPAVKSESIAIPARMILPVAAAVAPAPGEAEDERRGEQAEEERADRDQGDRRGEGDQDQDRAEARAAGHADHVGRGERVGERALQDRPGDAERGADDQRFDRPRQAQRSRRSGGWGRSRPCRAGCRALRRAAASPRRAPGRRRSRPARPATSAAKTTVRAGHSVMEVALAHPGDRAGDVGSRLQQRVVDRDVEAAGLRRLGRATRPGRSSGTWSAPGCPPDRRGGRR